MGNQVTLEQAHVYKIKTSTHFQPLKMYDLLQT